MKVKQYLTFILLCLIVVCAGCVEKNRQTIDRQLDDVIKWQLDKEDNALQKDKVLIALYLDDNGYIKDPAQKAEYYCYDIEGGYRPGQISYGSPWTTWERVHTNRFKKKIVIDPGPPYKTITKFVTLIPGRVTNLGRIKLEKVRAWGTASVSGTVKTEDDVALEGATVFLKDNPVTTDSQGNYTISGLRLGDYRLQIIEKGYISKTAKISIRNMENRKIRQDITLSYPREVSFRYVICPGSVNDFSDSRSSGGTMSLLIDDYYFYLPVDLINNEDFKQFVKKTLLNFRLNKGLLTLDNSHAPIFYEHIPASSMQFEEGISKQQALINEFEMITAVDPLDYNDQRGPAIEEGDIVLIDGDKISDYKLKLLFEKITPVIP